MKKKVKAVRVNATGDDALVGYIKPIHPKVNRQLRTSAAMISLAISMGASSLLLTRQSDQALAADAVGTESAATTAPAADAVVNVAPTQTEEPQIVSSPSVQQLETSAQEYSKASKQIAPEEISVPIPVQTASAGVENSTEVDFTSNPVNLENQQMPVEPEVDGDTAVQPETVNQTTPVAAEVNSLLKAKQKLALNRLKEKSQRLEDSLVRLRSEENAELAVPAAVDENFADQPQPQTKTATPDLKPKSVAAVPELPTSAVTSPTLVMPSAGEVYQVKPGDTLAAIAREHGISVFEIARANNLDNPNKLQINQKLTIPETANNSNPAAVVAMNTPAVDQPQSLGIVPSSQKAAAVNPTLPTALHLSPTTPTVSNNRASLPTAIATAQPIPAQAESTPAKSLVAQLKAGRATVAMPTTVPAAPIAPTATDTLVNSNQESAPASTVISSTPERKVNSSQANLRAQVPSKAPTTSYGVGGTIPPAEGTQVARSVTVARGKQTANPYLQNLRQEIVRLRQKYRSQQSGNNVVVPVVNSKKTDTRSDNVAVSIPVPTLSTPRIEPVKPQFAATRRNAQEPINPEFVPSRSNVNNLRVPTTTTRARVATAPTTFDPSDSFGSVRGRQVSPQLPPLAPSDNYLPNPSAPTPAPMTGFIWPARGVLTSGYGPRWGRMHRGIDIAAPTGTPIFASAPGVVIRSGWNSGGYGNVVDIRHPDGSMTRYGHNSRLFVRQGEVVQQGQHIAAMGSTGYSTGPHSHFEIHTAGRGAVNPMAFLPRR